MDYHIITVLAYKKTSDITRQGWLVLKLKAKTLILKLNTESNLSNNILNCYFYKIEQYLTLIAFILKFYFFFY